MAEPEKKTRPTRHRRRRGRARSRNRGNRAPLHQRTASHFRDEDRQRGANYFSQDRVQLEVSGTRARAWVRGTDNPVYGVGLEWSGVAAGRKLHAYCQCERFAGGTPCKHLWATLLELSSNHADSQPPGTDRVGLSKDRPARWRDLAAPADAIDGEAALPPAPKRRQKRARRGRRRGQDGASSWKTQLATVRQQVEKLSTPAAAATKPVTEANEVDIRFLVNTSASQSAGAIVLDIFGRRMTQAGKPGKLKRASIDIREIEKLLLPEDDRKGDDDPTIVAALPIETPRGQNRSRGKQNNDAQKVQRLRLPQRLNDQVLPYLCKQGVLGAWDGRRLGDPQPLNWDKGKVFQLALHLEFAAAGRARLRGVLERNGTSVTLSKAQLILPLSGNGATAPSESSAALVLFSDSISRLELEPQRDLPWIELLRGRGEIVFPEEDLEEAVTSVLEMPLLPRVEAPEELQLSQENSTPCPRLKLEPEDAPEWMNPQLVAELSFRYGDIQINAGDPRAAVVDWDGRSFVRRDMDVEHSALVRLLELGLKPMAGGNADGLELEPRQLPAVAEPLLLDGWEVETHGTSIRPPSPPALRVESGMDWFELSGQVDFDGDQIEFSKILEAISRGDRTLELEDGSKGLLPAAWMETYDSLAKLAHDSTENGLRFLPSQALLVDALLAVMPPADVDSAFAELREKLRTFESIKPKKEPRGFVGELRTYQRMGLGWLCFLREFGLGGVLADDMGLGKTVQALALLRTYRSASKSTKLPYLVVAPRSLIYNWIDEASRFTPKMKVVEYGGPSREALKKKLTKQDLVVTTYGTMRRDIGYLATVEFDTIILDEAQAIKNPESQTAKASRLLDGRHRLALTGTPIENHLGELGSIFEFLNPGLLGRLPALDVLAGGREASQQELALVAKGIRPFILRRTKEEVLPDLPEKTEQILQCSLGEQQRELYDQLRVAYRESLLEQVETKGVKGSTMQVLEALLRLRQVACHPGLVNPEWEEAGSAKLESLFEQVKEVLAEGHKVLIFSQFTKLLAYVRRHLDAEEIEYAYLDGQTRNRGEVVDYFQSDPSCNLFLISLKAGGTGLNLTAAGYVFLLDPWWNPAVEAQAIDRTHRIGQTQPVFAYRLIAQDTVEEKMVELQASKRKLADAILEGEGSKTLRDLTADDLRLLLS